jgi:hypothetical protein
MEQIFWKKCKHVVLCCGNGIWFEFLFSFFETAAASFCYYIWLIYLNVPILYFFNAVIREQRKSCFLFRRDQFLRKRCVTENIIILKLFDLKSWLSIILACDCYFHGTFITLRLNLRFILSPHCIKFFTIVIQVSNRVSI